MLLTQEWHDHLTLARNLDSPGERNELYVRVRRGELVAVCRGVYIASELWGAMDSDARYRARVKSAAVLSDRELVFSHHSAAAMWRLPIIGTWPQRLHVVEPRSGGGRSSRMVFRHTVGPLERTETIEGITVTSLGRTVVDVARVCSFRTAVAIADAALRRTDHPIPGVPRTFLEPDDLIREVAELALRQGTAKAMRVIAFADGAADRPGESLSRVSMRSAGIAPPLLQAELAGASGKRYFVDFWWPEFNVIGEFDGRDKYRNPEFLRGRSPERALADEKDREDDLRAAGHGMCRWGWDVASSPRLLATRLLRAGVR